MKITKTKLVEIIKEELGAVLNEEEADCRHLFGREYDNCIEQAKNRNDNRGQPAEDLATVVGREMSGSLKSRERKLDILDRIHSGEIKTVEKFRTALEAAKNAESLDDYQEAYEAARKEIELYKKDGAPTPEEIEAQMLKTSKGGLKPRPNDDGIDF